MYNTYDGPEEYRINSYYDNVDFFNENPFDSLQISIKNLGKIAGAIFSNPKIASYRYNNHVKVSLFFDEKTSIDKVCYIIGDENNLKQLLAKDDICSIKIIEHNREVESLSRHNTLFLFQNKNDVEKLNATIVEANLDLKYYNFMWTTVEESIDHDKIDNKLYPRTENEHMTRRRETIMTNSHLDKENDNVLIKYEDGDVKFDFAYKENINVIAAQTGNLKSTFVNNLAAAFVNPSNDLGLTFHDYDKKDGVVLLFDTETDKNTLTKKWDFYSNQHKNLSYFSLTHISKDERLIYLNSIIKSYQDEGKSIRAVVIDGLLDFIVDFNNIEDSDRLIESMLKLIREYDTSLFITFQENPSRYNGSKNKLAGHIGTNLDRKCNSHFKTSAKDDVVEVSGQKNRTEKTFTIIYDIDASGNQILLKNNGIKKKRKKVGQKKLDILRNNIDDAFLNATELSNKEMEQWIMSKLELEERAISTWKSKMMEAGIIERVKRGRSVFWIKG